MSGTRCATIQTDKRKNCFISVSKSWVHVEKLRSPLVVEVGHSNGNVAHLWWNGATLDADDAIGLNSLFLDCLHFQAGQKVTVKLFEGSNLQHCTTVYVEPANATDYQNLGLAQDKVKRSLLNQITIVWPRLQFPVWIKHIPFLVHVVKVDPSSRRPTKVVDGTNFWIMDASPNVNYSELDFGTEATESGALVRSHGSGNKSSPGFFQRASSYIFGGDPQQAGFVLGSETEEKPSFIAVQKISLGLRTVPLAVTDELRTSPTTIYVHESALLRRGYRSEGGPFLAVISKLLSPKEREEVVAKEMSPADRKTSEENSVFAALVVVVSDVSLSEYDVEVPFVLRRQMGLERGSRLRISSIHHHESASGSITLFPLCKLPQEVKADSAQEAFCDWMNEVSREWPFVASSGGLVHLFFKGGYEFDFVLKVKNSSETPSPPSSVAPHKKAYVLLSQRSAMEIGLGPSTRPYVMTPWLDKLPHTSITSLDINCGGLPLNRLGGISEVAERIVSSVELWLGMSPLAKQFSAIPATSRTLLVCGQKGIGKTTLLTSVCHEMERRGIYATVVNCALLKGSRIETIKKQLDMHCAEGVHRQPSLIFLDDIDVLSAAPTGPADEDGPQALYYTRNAQVLHRTLKRALERDVRLAFVATGISTNSIHPSLITTRGRHVFQDVIELQPPDSEQRRQILESLLRCKFGMEDADVTRSVAESSEGYLASDLDTLVDRANHAAWMRTGHQSSSEGIVERDFETARDNFRPSSLRSLKLHVAGSRSWSEVGGLADVQHSLLETIVWPTKYPSLFASCPIRMQSSMLLYGPPGTGKTLLAAVLAAECKLNFISIKGPELLSKYTGASEQAVRDLFERAQSAKPCILFFDEFDSIAPRRGHDNTGVTDRVVNQFLTQLDGVETLKGVYVLAATSRPDIIDPALLRPGRLDKFLYCPLPNEAEREEILRCLSRNLTLDPDVDLASLASRTDHFSGADLQALLYGAQLESLHGNKDKWKRQLQSEEEEEFVRVTCDGRVNPMDFEESQKLLQLIATIKDNVMGTVGSGEREASSAVSSIRVSVQDLERSLSRAKPSVGPGERLRYKILFDSFSKGGVPPPPKGGKRITLA